MSVDRITFQESLDYDARFIGAEGAENSLSRIIGASVLWLSNRIFRDDKTAYPGWNEFIEPQNPNETPPLT